MLILCSVPTDYRHLPWKIDITYQITFLGHCSYTYHSCISSWRVWSSVKTSVTISGFVLAPVIPTICMRQHYLALSQQRIKGTELKTYPNRQYGYRPSKLGRVWVIDVLAVCHTKYVTEDDMSFRGLIHDRHWYYGYKKAISNNFGKLGLPFINENRIRLQHTMTIIHAPSRVALLTTGTFIFIRSYFRD